MIFELTEGQWDQVESWLQENDVEVDVKRISLNISEEHLDTIDHWVRNKEREVVEERRKKRLLNPPAPGSMEAYQAMSEEESGVPYHGAIGGGTTYILTPGDASLGISVRVHGIQEVLEVVPPGWSGGEPEGPVLSYVFSPTSIGIVEVVKCSTIEDSLNVTDYDQW